MRGHLKMDDKVRWCFVKKTLVKEVPPFNVEVDDRNYC